MPIQQVSFDARSKVPVKIWTNDIDVKTKTQLDNLATMPFIFPHIAVMADCHLGKGATIGSVIPCRGAVIPASVGVDLGCGMSAAKLNLKVEELPDTLHPVRLEIERLVPHGRSDGGGRGDYGAWGDLPADVAQAWFHEHWGGSTLQARLDAIGVVHPGIVKKPVNAERHLGTLGTGNHFVEVCFDENNDIWVMLHSGSRGIGNRIGTYFIELAKKDMKKWFINLPDEDLAYLPEGSDNFNDYVQAVSWAQDFAKANREIMLKRTLRALSTTIPVYRDGHKDLLVQDSIIDCHHNYLIQEHHFDQNVWVTRKGAIRARVGDLGIIPGSMGTGSFIVEGKGNLQSFHSCSHGAGRRMSRGEAARTFTVEDLIKQTDGIECKKDLSIIDEIPGAYKDIYTVMENQSDLVSIKHKLLQIINVKG
jgi:tRNA-splicing ligase RtcB